MQNLRLQVLSFLVSFCALINVNGQSGFPVSEFIPVTPPSLTRAIDETRPVYSIPGTINVANGAAHYNIPIDIPAGVNGMQPSISIGYSSSSGNGLLGYGWNLSGLSAISRSADNIVFNGQRYAAQLSNNDQLSLDGQTLVLESGSKFQSGCVYRTGIESFQRITMVSDGFVVQQKDGVKRYYGSSSSSRIDVTQGSGAVTITWLMDKMEDRNGNKILYDYIKDASTGEYRLNKIRYTQNEGVAAKSEIEFHYANRFDNSPSYRYGNLFPSNYILTSIRSTYDSQEYSEYTFKYSWRTGVTGNDFSRLVEIGYSAKGTDVIPTLIQWNPAQVESTFSTNIYPDYNHGGYGQKVIMDINGDGVDDVLSLEYEHIDDGECDVLADGKPPFNISNWEFEVWKNVKNPSTAYFTRTRIINPFYSQYKPQNCLRWAFCRIYGGDFNGDLLDDFLLLRAQINGAGNSSSNTYHIDFYMNSPSSPGTFTMSKTMQIGNHLPIDYSTVSNGWREDDDYSANQHPFLLIVNDFDGDGISDISYHGYPSSTSDEDFPYPSYWNIHFVNSNLSTQFHSVPTELLGWGRIDQATFGDFNGDGKVDPLFFELTGSTIVAGKDRTTWSPIYSGTFPSATVFAKVGDFNGDGISDLLYKNSGSSAFYIKHFNGESFSSTAINPSINYNINIYSGYGHPYNTVLDPPIPFVFDADMDGRSDVAFFASSGSNYEIKTYYNKVNGWLSSSTPISASLVYSFNDNDDFDVVDFDGSGRPQLFYFTNVNGGPNYGFLQTYRPEDQSLLVSKILDGFNRLTEFSFAKTTDVTAYSRAVETYPNPSIMKSISVLRGFTVKDFKDQLYRSQWYVYDNLRVNLKGLGMLGFDKVTVTEYVQERRTEIYSDLIPGSSGDSWPFMTTEVKNKLISGGNISSTKSVYSSTLKKTVGSEFNFETRIASVERKDYVQGVSSKTDVSSYDASGNVLGTTVRSYDNTTFALPYVVQKATNISYTDDGSWLDWQIDNQSIITTRNGQPSVSVVTDFDYDATKGLLIKRTDNPGTDAQVEVAFGYDVCGNVTSKVVSPNGMSSRNTSYSWTTDKRFVETETNPLSWVVKTYDYNHLHGVVSEVTDQNGLIMEYQYDDFGRVTRVDYPDNNFTTHSWNWDAGATFAQSLFFIATSGPNEEDKEVWYNGKELLIKNKRKDRNGDWVFEHTAYDSKRRVQKKSLPYFNGTTPQWIEYTYKPDGRVQAITSPSTTITKTYSGLTTTTTNDATGVSKIHTLDASGLLVSAEDPGGTINYTYNSFGKPTQISSSSLSSTMSYDVFGRQESLYHSGAGTMYYEYDALGQLIYQEDGESNIFTMTYDKLGRLTQKSGSDGDYDYTYDSNLKGYLYEASSPYQTWTSYGYDNLGRLNEMREYVLGDEYEFYYDHDQYSNLTYIQYPNGLNIEYVVDSEGRIDEIMNGNDQQLIWSYGDVNVMGRITEFDLGPSSTVTRAYNGTNWTLEDYVNPGLAEFSYGFNGATGNLSERANNTYGLEESFSYDELDRLEAQTFTSGGNYLPSGISEISLAYADDGSIDFKTDVGAYTHEGGQTHLIEDNPNTISNDDQFISYTPFNSVNTIMEGAFDAAFVYGYDNQRRRMKIENAGQTYVERYYLASGSYERDYRNGAWRNLVYINTPTGQNAVYINDEGQHNHELYLLDLDHVGSIVGVSDASGNLVEEYSYDPWGNRRDPQTWENEYNPGQGGNLWSGLLSRGFTGHEHLDCFGLINMNGRVYDPLLGRMLSPDDHVQDVSFTQNINRFSYALNNPLRYTDPSGELLEQIFIPFMRGFVNGFFSTNYDRAGAGWDEGVKTLENNIAIKNGLFKTDENLSDFERVGQLGLRFTLEFPQTLMGYGYSQIRNNLGEVDEVSYYGGATLVNKVEAPDDDGITWRNGLTLGSYINSKNLEADIEDNLFRHEYGHVIQSRIMGPLYVPYVGHASGLGSLLDDFGLHDHNDEWNEIHANELALRYFNEHEPDAMLNEPWDFDEYPTQYVGDWYSILQPPPSPLLIWFIITNRI